MLKINSLIVAVGFTAMTGQLVIIRLIAQIFNGNELTMCIAIGHWLFWTGVGSYAGSRIANRKLLSDNLLTIILIYVVLLLTSVNLIWILRHLMGISISEMVGLDRIFLRTGLLMMLPSFTNGLFFPALVAWVAKLNVHFPVNNVYISETVGSAVGSIVFIGLIVSGVSSTVFMTGTLSLLLLIAGLVLLNKRRSRIFIILLSLCLFVLSGQVVIPRLLAIRWFPYRVVEYRETPHQVISVLSYEDNISVFSNNEPLLTSGVPEIAEEAVHFAMLNHPAPHRVLIIGPANRAILQQLAKYPGTDSVTIVQNDKILDKIIGKYSLEMPDIGLNVRRIIDDPFRFIRKSKSRTDVVLVNLPLPVNAMWNVYYSRGFFRELKKSLDERAVVALQFPGSETYLNAGQLQFLKLVENTVRSVFRHFVWIPGETLHLLVSDRPLTNNCDDLLLEMQYRGIQNRYINSHYLRDRLSPMKIDFLEKQLHECQYQNQNTILKPAAFYYSTILWDQQTGGVLKRVYPWFAANSPLEIGSVIVVIFIIFSMYLKIKKKRTIMTKFLMGLLGYAIMSFEAVVIISLQSFAGSLYLRVAFLSMAFMLGAAAGAAGQRRYNRITNSQIITAVGIFLGIVIVYGILLGNRLTSILGVAGVHYLVLFICGSVGGFVFPILCENVRKTKGTSAADASGSVYAWDILGSCLGVYLTSGLIIPVYGLMAVIWFTVIIILFLGAIALLNNLK